jgi:hypothetical protein
MSSYNKTPGDDHPVLIFLIISMLAGYTHVPGKASVLSFEHIEARRRSAQSQYGPHSSRNVAFRKRLLHSQP